MTFTYYDNIPNGPNNPSVDQPQMFINTNSIDQIIDVDHVSFNQANGGYHEIIHQVTQGSDPAAIPGVNQVYSKLYTPNTAGGTADTQLFNRTGGGGISQLTGNSVNNATDGWCWEGGILIQWGIKSSPGNGAGSVTFQNRVAGAIPFPNNCFVVVVTAKRTGTPSGVDQVYVQSQNAGGFTYFTTTTGTGFNSFSWVAIGN